MSARAAIAFANSMNWQQKGTSQRNSTKAFNLETRGRGHKHSRTGNYWEQRVNLRHRNRNQREEEITNKLSKKNVFNIILMMNMPRKTEGVNKLTSGSVRVCLLEGFSCDFRHIFLFGGGLNA